MRFPRVNRHHPTRRPPARSSFVLLFLLLLLPLSAQEEPEDDGCRVAVLGYHVFHATRPASQMRISTEKFAAQMQRIKESGIPVISLPQFLAWRRGKGEIPPQSILLTMDDGWRSVYQEAYPILQELKFPFTIYLYQNYVGADKGSRALTLEMIREMMDSGLCSIGSHSVSHPFPSEVRREKRRGDENFRSFLKKEFGQSKHYLEETFAVDVTTYAYPGGFHLPEMDPISEELGYDQLFTVKPGKVSRLSNKFELPRYIILGNHQGAFEAALTFRNSSSHAIASTVELPFTASPAPGEVISSRTPEISIGLSSVEDLSPETLDLRVAGFGKVPASFDPETKTLSWQVSRPLRQPACLISLSWSTNNEPGTQGPHRWSFKIDRSATYLKKP